MCQKLKYILPTRSQNRIFWFTFLSMSMAARSMYESAILGKFFLHLADIGGELIRDLVRRVLHPCDVVVDLPDLQSQQKYVDL